MNLHPGVVPVLMMLTADELGIARMMSTGDIASPHRYRNVTLLNLRITGTGFSHRPALNEYVYRRPENYLTPDFLARCSGLSVIWEHPEKSLLSSEEYAARNIGAVMLPYIKDDEVWAIARVYDDEAIRLLAEKQLSTSPAVLLEKGTKLKLEDGSNLLIEEKASLLDHIAVCENGVWDKGEGPTGIEASNIRGDSIMAVKTAEEMKKDAEEEETKKREDSARVDADKRMDEKLDLLLKGIDSVRQDVSSCNERMDAFEEEEKKGDAAHRKDGNEDVEAERLAADRKRKDSEDKEKKEEEDRKDALRADTLQKRLDEQDKQLKALTDLVRQPIPESHRTELAELQSRADAVLIQLGERASPPMVGETPAAYDRRILGGLIKYSDRWKDKPIQLVPDALLDNVRSDIYADALARAKSPNDIAPGKMREVTKQLPSGHSVTEFFGRDVHFSRQFARPARRVRSFRTSNAI